MVLHFLPLLFLFTFIGAVTGVRLVIMNETLQHVIAGKNVSLHCEFIPEENHEPDQLEVQWHVQKGSQWTVVQTFKAKQMANKERQYYGRFWIDPNKLVDGIASLQIQNVMLKDSGEYRCIIIDGVGAAFESSQLIVLAPYTDPQITKHYTEAEELVLQCRSQDGYPKGEVKWFDGNGTELQWQGSTEHILTNEGNFQIINNLSLPLNEEVRICCSISHNTNLFEKKVTCHTVIAPYSEPYLIKNYGKETFILQCRSHGGFPKAVVIWQEMGGGELIKNITTEQIFTSNEDFDVISNLSLKLNESLHVCCSVFHAILYQNKTACERITAITAQHHRWGLVFAFAVAIFFVIPLVIWLKCRCIVSRRPDV